MLALVVGVIDQLGYPYCRGRIFEYFRGRSGAIQRPKRSILGFWSVPLYKSAMPLKFEEDLTLHSFAHMEEIDLCWRAQNKGMTVTYVGLSTVYHVGGASLKTSNPKKTFLNFRNSLYTLVKNTHQPLLLVVFLRLILDGIAGVRFLLQAKPKHMIAIIRAHGSFYTALPLFTSI